MFLDMILRLLGIRIITDPVRDSIIGVIGGVILGILLVRRGLTALRHALILLIGMLLYSVVATALIWLVAYFWFELSSAPVELALAVTVLAIILFTVIGYKGYTRAKQLLEDFFEQEQTVQ
jgi:type VI protein secretion system component VasK